MPHMQRKNKKRRPAGFTFIELLIVAAIIPVISLAVYAAFNSGLKVWQRVNYLLPEEDLNILFDKFTSDLKNTFKFTGINFSGEEGRIELAALVKSRKLQAKTVGSVIYIYDPAARTFTRMERDFSRIYDSAEGIALQSIKDVKSLKFRYYFYDSQKKEYLWQEEWAGEGLPLAVRMELELANDGQYNMFTRTVSIPVNS